MGKDLKGKELGTGISQRKDGRYTARYIDRFGKRKQVYGDTLKEVKNLLSKRVAEDICKHNVVDESTTLDDWYKKWMAVYKIPAIRLNTKRHYEHVYTKHISPKLGHMKLSEISKFNIAELLKELKEQGYQWETQTKVKRILVDMFNRALEDDFVLKNPAKGIRVPTNKPQNDIKALSIDDQNDFLECAAGTFYYNLYVVAINTGLRPGELLALEESDIYFKRKKIKVTKTLLYQKLDGDEGKEFHIGDPKTKSSVREIPINKVCENALIKQIYQKNVIRNKTPKKDFQYPNLLFTTKYNTPINTEIYSESIRRIVDEINLTRDTIDEMEYFSGHAFRHTFATRCFEAGISPKTVQSYLGHATLNMTMDLYTSVMEDKKKADMEIFEKSVGIKPQDIHQYSEGNIIKLYG